MAGSKACENVTLSINSVDFSAVTDEVTIEMDVGTLEYQDLSACAVNKEPTFPRFTISHKGYYNGPDAGELEGEINAALGVGTTALAVPVVVTLSDGTTTVTYTMTEGVAYDVNVNSTPDGVLNVEATWRPLDGALTRT